MFDCISLPVILKIVLRRVPKVTEILSHKGIETYRAVTNNQTKKKDDVLKGSTLEIIYGRFARTILAFTLQLGSKTPVEHLHYAAV